MTSTQFHAWVVVTASADYDCKLASGTAQGFDTPGLKDKYIAGVTKGFGTTITPTAAQAEQLWTAIVAYCAAD